jgi:hypothetical protein
VALLGATSLAVSALVGPAAVFGATPNWVGHEVEELPPVVSPGMDAGYRVSITNNGPSNISQLYLVTPNADTPNPSYVDPSQGSCSASGPLFCSLGALRKNRTATVIVAFPTPADATGSFTVDFEWNTTGLGSGGSDSDQSHGDAVEQTGVTMLSGDAEDFAGGFLIPDESNVVSNSQSVSGSNPQTTLIVSPADGIAVTVQDGPGVEDPGCPAPFTCWGQTSEIHVGDGSDAYGAQMVVIQVDGSIVRPGVNKNNLKVIHFDDEGVPTEVTASCNRNNPRPDCKIVENIPGGGFKVTLWLESNGFIKFG